MSTETEPRPISYKMPILAPDAEYITNSMNELAPLLERDEIYDLPGAAITTGDVDRYIGDTPDTLERDTNVFHRASRAPADDMKKAGLDETGLLAEQISGYDDDVRLVNGAFPISMYIASEKNPIAAIDDVAVSYPFIAREDAAETDRVYAEVTETGYDSATVSLWKVRGNGDIVAKTGAVVNPDELDPKYAPVSLSVTYADDWSRADKKDNLELAYMLTEYMGGWNRAHEDNPYRGAEILAGFPSIRRTGGTLEDAQALYFTRAPIVDGDLEAQDAGIHGYIAANEANQLSEQDFSVTTSDVRLFTYGPNGIEPVLDLRERDIELHRKLETFLPTDDVTELATYSAPSTPTDIVGRNIRAGTEFWTSVIRGQPHTAVPRATQAWFEQSDA